MRSCSFTGPRQRSATDLLQSVRRCVLIQHSFLSIKTVSNETTRRDAGWKGLPMPRTTSIAIAMMALMLMTNYPLAQNKSRTLQVKAGRSGVRSQHAMVASSQPLASQVGLEVLRRGGNAVDASIAMAAMLNVTEPMMTGIGGDAFMLVYWSKTKELKGLNASGRAPRALT